MEDSVVVSAPVEKVFDVVADFGNAGKWHANLKQVGFKTAEPPHLGSEYDWVESFMGKTMDLGGVITEWDRPRGFTWKPIAGPYTMSGGWRFEQDGTGTKATRYSDTELSGLMRFAAALATPIAKRQVRHDLARLKGLIEAQSTA